MARKRKNNSKARTRPAPRRKKKTRRTRVGRGMPASYNGRARSRFKSTRVSGSSIRVSGYDLVYSVDPSLVPVDGIFSSIPCNPAYWAGTRVAKIAAAYSQYRPIEIAFHYYPQVSTMTSGLVTIGTIWNNNASSDTLQQSLATSNGGKVFPVYQRQSSVIKLGTNLNQNLFTFPGDINEETNPFMFLALSQQTNGIVPGYVMVKYTFEFKNPIGDANLYDSVTKTAGEITKQDVWTNTSAVLLTPSATLSPGTLLTLKVVDGLIQFFFGGSKVGVAAELLFKLLRNEPINVKEDDEHDDIIILEEANQLTHMHGYISVSNTSSVVSTEFNIINQNEDFLTLDNFQVYEGTNYKTAGLLFLLFEKSNGVYDIYFQMYSDAVPYDVSGHKYTYWVAKSVSSTNNDMSALYTTYTAGVADSDYPPQIRFKSNVSGDTTITVPIGGLFHQDDLSQWPCLRSVQLKTKAEVLDMPTTVVGQGRMTLRPKTRVNSNPHYGRMSVGYSTRAICSVDTSPQSGKSQTGVVPLSANSMCLCSNCKSQFS